MRAIADGKSTSRKSYGPGNTRGENKTKIHILTDFSTLAVRSKRKHLQKGRKKKKKTRGISQEGKRKKKRNFLLKLRNKKGERIHKTHKPVRKGEWGGGKGEEGARRRGEGGRDERGVCGEKGEGEEVK